LPYYRWRLDAPISRPGYPADVRTVGDHVLRSRFNLGLNRKAAAATLGIDPETLKNWEEGRTEPEVRFYPALIRFLVYNPPSRAKDAESSDPARTDQSGVVPSRPS
jgi:DNA-binding XRE family transcriptional regulator